MTDRGTPVLRLVAVDTAPLLERLTREGACVPCLRRIHAPIRRQASVIELGEHCFRHAVTEVVRPYLQETIDSTQHGVKVLVQG